jgi:hypothetical protein
MKFPLHFIGDGNISVSIQNNHKNNNYNRKEISKEIFYSIKSKQSFAIHFI